MKEAANAAQAAQRGGRMLEEELLDSAPLTYEDRRRALADLSRSNRWLLGYLPVVRTLAPLIRRGSGPRRLLDVGTGSGEAAARVVAAARAADRVRVVGLDSQLAHLLIGREDRPEQLRVVGRADALPFRAGSVDWSLSTLFFHHFDALANRSVLAEMRRVTRRAVVVVDLRRGWVTRGLARLLLPLIGSGRVALHDGMVSVRRAFARRAVADVVRDWPVLELRSRFPCRFSLVLEGEGGAPPTCGAAGDVRE